MEYRELLQLVMHSLNKPNTDAKQQLGNISRKIAQCVTELASAAEQLKDDDWVDPSDPTFIAENELLGAAKSIENAARKLSTLKPRKEIKGKVSLSCAFFNKYALEFMEECQTRQAFLSFFSLLLCVPKPNEEWWIE